LEKTWFIICGEKNLRKDLMDKLTNSFFKIAIKWSDDELPRFEAG